MKKWFSLLMVVAAFALVAAGCGDDNDDNGGGAAATTAEQPAPATTGEETSTEEAGGGGGGEKLSLAADPGGQLAFDKKTLSAKSGQVEIVMTNDSDVPHNVSIEGNGIDKDGPTVTKSTSTVSADLKPGKYTFYCSVPGHREAGMEGTLTVK